MPLTHCLPRLRFCSLLLSAGLAATLALADEPKWAIVDTTSLNAELGNAGKGILDPQASGFMGVAFGNGLFVATVQSLRETVLRWATSPDGLHWTAHSQTIANGSISSGVSKVHFLNNQFVFFANHGKTDGFGIAMCYTSSDGLTWTGTRVADGSLGVVDFDSDGKTMVVAGTNGAQFMSTDLVTWKSSPVVTNGGVYSHNDLSYGVGHFISTINGFGGQTYTSTDGLTWTALTGAAAPGGGTTECGNGCATVLINAVWYRSTDGVNFPKVTPVLPTGFIAPGTPPRFTGGRFVSAAFNLNEAGKEHYMVSSDAITWTAFGEYLLAPAVPLGQSRLYFHNDVAYGNGKYVFVGQDIAQNAAGKTTLPWIATTDAPPAPVPANIVSNPAPQTISVGGTVVFSVSATGAISYKWKLNGTAIANATSATLVIRNATTANAGTYTVDITNDAGTITSTAATLTLSTNPDFGRISNLSILTNITATEPSFTVGTVIAGNGTKPLLLRAAGPSLTPLGVGGALADPKMDVFAGQTIVATNDNWGGDTTLANAFGAVGAFAYVSSTSKDAAVFRPDTPAQPYTVQISGVGGATGAVIAELYDSTPNGTFTAATPRLANVSVLKNIPAGQILTAGFVIGGSTAKTVLIRVIGPQLGKAPFNIGGVMADPKLDLFSGQTVIASNDNWGGDAQLTTVGTAVGAFAVTDAASKDAILLATLKPGNYTVQASGVNGTGGMAIVEVYEVP